MKSAQSRVNAILGVAVERAATWPVASSNTAVARRQEATANLAWRYSGMRRRASFTFAPIASVSWRSAERDPW